MAQGTKVPGVFLPFEEEARHAGYYTIVGIDEAGRGPLAGPVVAAAVVLPWGCPIQGVQDSKRLTARQRDTVYARIQANAVAYGIGMMSPQEIDRHNILWATRQAMCHAVQQLCCAPDVLLIDGPLALPLLLPQRPIIRGDACCASIAAASILAKVTRDRLMCDYAQQFPAYGFDKHKGYPTSEHYARLRQHGPCAIHRRTFRGVVTEDVA